MATSCVGFHGIFFNQSRGINVAQHSYVYTVVAYRLYQQIVDFCGIVQPKYFYIMLKVN